MVGVLLVSHSAQIADGVKAFVDQVGGGQVRVAAAGGTDDDRLGTSIGRIETGLRAVDSTDGILVLVDIGGAVLGVEMALDMLCMANVLISDAPLVEGAYLAVLEASTGAPLQAVAAAALRGREMVKVQR